MWARRISQWRVMADGRARGDFALDSGKQSVSASHLLLAVGRRPNTENPRPGRGRRECRRAWLHRRRRRVGAPARPGVWALGDVNGRGAFTHTSYNDFEIVAANLLDGGHAPSLRPNHDLRACSPNPPLGRIGMSEAEVRRERQDGAWSRPLPMGARPAAARERGEDRRGFMKVLVDANTQTHPRCGAARPSRADEGRATAAARAGPPACPTPASSRRCGSTRTVDRNCCRHSSPALKPLS